MKVLFAGPKYGPQSNIKQMVHSLPEIKRLAGPDGRSPVFRSCLICQKFQFYSDKIEGKWYVGIKFPGNDVIKLSEFSERLRAIMPLMAEKSGIFPAVSHGYCHDCMQLVEAQIKAER